MLVIVVVGVVLSWSRPSVKVAPAPDELRAGAQRRRRGVGGGPRPHLPQAVFDTELVEIHSEQRDQPIHRS